MVTFRFFDLLHIALKHKDKFSQNPTEKEWRELFILCKEQALIGIAYKAIERLSLQQRPPKNILLQWCLSAENIKSRNAQLDEKILNISQKFYTDGFDNIVLKGQSVAQYYKLDNLHQYRTPGDVDIWMFGKRDDIISYVQQHKPTCNIVYHHIDFPNIDDVEVEIHFTPSWMNNYFTNSKLQNYFHSCGETIFSKARTGDTMLPTLTHSFDRVYILVHIYRHLFHSGVGLKQLLDYYYVLKQGFTEDERKETMQVLFSLKMQRFAGAVMWVLQYVFGLEDQYLLVSPDGKDGRFLLDEIMLAGNMGQYDKRINRAKNNSQFGRFVRNVKRNFRFVRSYPSEVLWSPFFKIWHFFWRKAYAFKYK